MASRGQIVFWMFNYFIQLQGLEAVMKNMTEIVVVLITTAGVPYIGYKTKIEIKKAQTAEREEHIKGEKQQQLKKLIKDLRKYGNAMKSENEALKDSLLKIQMRCEAAAHATRLNYIPPLEKDGLIEELKALNLLSADKLIDSFYEQERILELMRDLFSLISKDCVEVSNNFGGVENKEP